MRTFEVFLNRKRLCVAGIEADCVLAAIVNYVSVKRGRFHLNVGGLNTVKDEHVRRWIEIYALAMKFGFASAREAGQTNPSSAFPKTGQRMWIP